jgi:hypothetical protein
MSSSGPWTCAPPAWRAPCRNCACAPTSTSSRNATPAPTRPSPARHPVRTAGGKQQPNRDRRPAKPAGRERPRRTAGRQRRLRARPGPARAARAAVPASPSPAPARASRRWSPSPCPWATAYGDSDTPGEAAGFGLLDADTARDLVLNGAEDAHGIGLFAALIMPTWTCGRRPGRRRHRADHCLWTCDLRFGGRMGVSASVRCRIGNVGEVRVARAVFRWQAATPVAPSPDEAAGSSLAGWMMIEVFGTVAARRALTRRMLACPACGQVLRPWGRARERTIRDPDGAPVTVRPDRGRCIGCGVTHVVLGAGLLPRRAYAAGLIGEALLAAVGGTGTGSSPGTSMFPAVRCAAGSAAPAGPPPGCGSQASGRHGARPRCAARPDPPG